jgi:hypothetical protein
MTREAFDAQCAAVKQIERSDGRIVAAVAVGLGLGQLALIRWADTNLAHDTRVELTGAVFLAYIAIVGWLVWRFERRRRAARPRCPQCGAMLKDASERAAAETGTCHACGGFVIDG